MAVLLLFRLQRLRLVAEARVLAPVLVRVDAVERQLAPLREMTDLPLCVGFGIRDGDTAAAVGRVADGVIVGSALVSRIAENAETPEAIPAALKAVLGDMRDALDRSDGR